MAREGGAATAVLEVKGVQWASEKARVEAILGRRPGVIAVDANPVAQTASVTYDDGRTSIAELTRWIRDCGYHCAGRSVPDHVCDPLAEGDVPGSASLSAAPAPAAAPADHGEPAGLRSPPAVMGHGGHGGMSMADDGP